MVLKKIGYKFPMNGPLKSNPLLKGKNIPLQGILLTDSNVQLNKRFNSLCISQKSKKNNRSGAGTPKRL